MNRVNVNLKMARVLHCGYHLPIILDLLKGTQKIKHIPNKDSANNGGFSVGNINQITLNKPRIAQVMG